MNFLDYEGLRYFYGKILARIKGLKAEDVGAAPASHDHSADDITSGTLVVSRGGTGATTHEEALSNLGAAAIKDHQIKTFNSLSQIGLTGKPTMDEFLAALPLYSRFMFDASSLGYEVGTGTANIPEGYGTLIIEKSSSNYRPNISYIGRYGTVYIGTFDNSGNFATWVSLLKADGSVPMIGDMHINKDEYPQLFMKETTTNAQGHIQVHGDGVMIESTPNADDENNRRYIMLYGGGDVSLKDSARLVDVVNGTKNWHTLYGSHNKPSGQYTGNGSAAARTINTGGVGNAIKIDGDSGMAIITRHGGIGRNGTSAFVISTNEAKFIDGVLTLATTNNVLNNNGENTMYQVL